MTFELTPYGWPKPGPLYLAPTAALDSKSRARRPEHTRYVKDHGVWSDLPFNRIRDDFEGYYPSAMWGGANAGVEFGKE